MKGLLSHKPAHPPGTHWEHSDSGYAMAGAMMERVTHLAWEDLMRTRLFLPLGLKSAGFGEVTLERHTYQSSDGGRTCCPLEHRARICENASIGLCQILAAKHVSLSGRCLPKALSEVEGQWDEVETPGTASGVDAAFALPKHGTLGAVLGQSPGARLATQARM